MDISYDGHIMRWTYTSHGQTYHTHLQLRLLQLCLELCLQMLQCGTALDDGLVRFGLGEPEVMALVYLVRQCLHLPQHYHTSKLSVNIYKLSVNVYKSSVNIYKHL